MAKLLVKKKATFKEDWLKSFFKYIEPAWLGDDGKLSVKRILSIVISIDLIRNIDRSIKPVSTAMQLLSLNKQPDAAVITAIGSFLSNIQMIIGIEASIVVALLGISAYASLKTNPNNIDKPAPTAVLVTNGTGGGGTS